MSRSGYSDDLDNWALIKWRGAVRSAIKGERGQRLLRELADAMDAMPAKRLIANELEADGEFCALGVLGCKRGLSLAGVDPEDRETVARMFDIAPALAAEIVYENDEAVDDWDFKEVEICGPMRMPQQHRRWVRVPVAAVAEKRWRHMREWVRANLRTDGPSPTDDPK